MMIAAAMLLGTMTACGGSESSKGGSKSGSKQADGGAADGVKITLADWGNLEWETYTDPDGYFTLEKPKGWTVDAKVGYPNFGLQIIVETADKSVCAESLDFILLDTIKMQNDPTAESLVKALYGSSGVIDLNVIEKTVPDVFQQINDKRSDVYDAGVVYADFQQNGNHRELMMCAIVEQTASTQKYACTTLLSGETPFGEYNNWADTLDKINQSIKYTDAYDALYDTSGSTGSAGSSTAQSDISAGSDAMMESWKARNKSEDIQNQKRQDATLGYERVYDTETGDIYRADAGFMESYDKMDGQRYAAATNDMYTEGYSGYVSLD